MSAARLIALDWGTSNLRAILLGTQGEVLSRRSAAGGIMALQQGQFAAALHALCADWLDQHPQATLMASGMIGSRQGWKEVPYLDCPARAEHAAAALEVVDTGLAARPLYIVPGLRCTSSSGPFDVMRGEETQVWGSALPAGACCILPGTHSKWVWTAAHKAGEIEGFRTYMTGELFAVLAQHSILGRLMEPQMQPERHPAQEAPKAFVQGVQAGLAGHADATHILFSVRTAGLMGQVPASELADYLSGMLIGMEVGSATRLAHLQNLGFGKGAPAMPVMLIGENALCQRYEWALREAGIATCRAPENPSATGLWKIANAAQLLA